MVAGINSFVEKFKGYEDCYTIIGGTACDILMSEAYVPFRATKDIDMILISEARDKEFVRLLWEFLQDGGYRFGWKSSEEVHFYRFTEPKAGFPAMIELFSRKPNYIGEVPSRIVPIHISDEISSLSAILLNDDFYNFMLSGRKTVSGLSVLAAEYLIPFKMYAWLDLKDKKANGAFVKERDLRKHKYDVFRLLQIADPSMKIATTGLVAKSIERFLDEIREEQIPFSQLGIAFEMDDALKALSALYDVRKT